MDQMQIGRFIAESRKARNLTQRQLADNLGISDKTVSKWETGKGLPEVSLMLPLCGELQITVNDLLSGERVSNTNYQKEAEENMKVENGKIIEITEQELYSRYIDGEYYMALDFNEYKWRMENAGTKIVK